MAKDPETKSLPGKPATLHERTACGVHKDGSYYLRATDTEDAGAIQKAAKDNGIALEHRRDTAVHHGRKGVYPHFHTQDPEHIAKLMNALEGVGPQDSDGAEADHLNTDTESKAAEMEAENERPGQGGGDTHVHIHLHDEEPEGRDIKKSMVDGYEYTNAKGTRVRVPGYSTAQMKHEAQAHGTKIHQRLEYSKGINKGPKAEIAHAASAKALAMTGQAHTPEEHEGASIAHRRAEDDAWQAHLRRADKEGSGAIHLKGLQAAHGAAAKWHTDQVHDIKSAAISGGHEVKPPDEKPKSEGDGPVQEDASPDPQDRSKELVQAAGFAHRSSTHDSPEAQKAAKHAHVAAQSAHLATAKTKEHPELHGDAEEKHMGASDAHGQAREVAAFPNTKEIHQHLAGEHQKLAGHHHDAKKAFDAGRQTHLNEAIQEAEQKEGISPSETLARHADASRAAREHSRGLELGGGVAPTAEAHYAAHEAHAHASDTAHAHAEALRANPDWDGGHMPSKPEGWDIAADDHRQISNWHKYLGDAKVRAREKEKKGRKVAKSLDAYLAKCDLLDAAQKWHSGRHEARNASKSCNDQEGMAAVRDAAFDALEAGMGNADILAIVKQATGSSEAHYGAVEALIRGVMPPAIQ